MQIEKLSESIINTYAIKSLTQEIIVSPKPGLVDRYDTGAHNDMDIYTFINSIFSLDNYFGKCYMAGINEVSLEKAFFLSKQYGLIAEKNMSESTSGINTHKGAIFMLGIISLSAGFTYTKSSLTKKNLIKTIKEISSFLKDDYKKYNTNGTRIYHDYGISGARGFTEDGYSFLIETSLSEFRDMYKKTLSLELSSIHTLMIIISYLDDTNIISRGGIENLNYAKKIAKDYINYGSILYDKNLSIIKKINIDFINKNISPGGAADCLSAVLFLDKIL